MKSFITVSESKCSFDINFLYVLYKFPSLVYTLISLKVVTKNC